MIVVSKNMAPTEVKGVGGGQAMELRPLLQEMDNPWRLW
jgi:hypothetical protein